MQLGTFVVEHLVLFESLLSPHGAQYKRLSTYRLTHAPARTARYDTGQHNHGPD